MKAFREELLKSLKYNSYPRYIQSLVDRGMVQECEEIEGIYYLMFAFCLHNQDFYNYKSNVKTDFVFHSMSDVIYVGGLSVDNKGRVLKGIVTPYYLNIRGNDTYDIFGEDNTKKLPYIIGTPQLFNKNDKLKIRHLFPCDESFMIFNLSTVKSTTWRDFLLGEESYKDTSFNENNKYACSYFGGVYSWNGIKIQKKYYGVYAEAGDAVPIQFVEEKLNNKTLLTSIAHKLICNPNKGLHELSKNCEKGFRSLSIATAYAGSEIRQGTTNIARSLSGLPIIE